MERQDAARSAPPCCPSSRWSTWTSRAGKRRIAATDLFDFRGRQLKGWTNKLIWGDNKLILSSLKSGALRRQIEDAGGLKLIYIDPPFDVGADFSMDIEIGGETFHKEAEPPGTDRLPRHLGARGGFVHLDDLRAADPDAGFAAGGGEYLCALRLAGERLRPACLEPSLWENSFQNEITWRRTYAHNDPGRYGNTSDTILFFSKSAENHI